jgi:hypothetical protein
MGRIKGNTRPATTHTADPGALPAPVPAASTAAIGDAPNEEADQPQQNSGDQRIPENMRCEPKPAKYGENQDLNATRATITASKRWRRRNLAPALSYIPLRSASNREYSGAKPAAEKRPCAEASSDPAHAGL